jgi:TolA-binding protein
MRGTTVFLKRQGHEMPRLKHLAGAVQIPLAVIAALVSFACTPAYEKPQQNDFFTPVDRIVHKKSISDTLAQSREHTSVTADDGLKDSLLVLYRQQSKRLSDMIQQVRLLAKNNVAGEENNTESFTENLAESDSLSNEVLLEKIKIQNQRLNGVIEQLKLLSNRQDQRLNQDRPADSTSQIPIQTTPVQQIPVRVTGAKAVPPQPASAQQARGSRNLKTSFNYGKAIELYNNRHYGKAINAFEKMLSQKIEPGLADRCHFWMGVCHLNLNRPNQALIEFNHVLEYANSEKKEESYFMMGQCYERNGAKKSAVMMYEKILRLYPQGKLAPVVEKKIALLK